MYIYTHALNHIYAQSHRHTHTHTYALTHMQTYTQTCSYSQQINSFEVKILSVYFACLIEYGST